MPEGRVRIITDSACDLDIDITDSLGVTVVPLSVEIDGVSYRDRIDITPGEMYRRMSEEGALPKSAQVTPIMFIEVFKKCIAEGDIPVYVGFSSKLSGTYNSGELAAVEFEKAYTVESKGASVGQGLIVQAAAQAAAAGKGPEEIVELVSSMASRMEHVFCVDSLDYLHKGGRISHTKAIVGSLLKIKPLLHFVDGAIYPLENARTSKKALNRLVDLVGERGVDIESQTIGINYAADKNLAFELRDMVKERYGVTDFLISEIGAAIGCHVGPGTCALFFLGAKQGGTAAKP